MNTLLEFVTNNDSALLATSGTKLVVIVLVFDTCDVRLAYRPESTPAI